jgi:hypothetical protein
MACMKQAPLTGGSHTDTLPVRGRNRPKKEVCWHQRKFKGGQSAVGGGTLIRDRTQKKLNLDGYRRYLETNATVADVLQHWTVHRQLRFSAYIKGQPS